MNQAAELRAEIDRELNELRTTVDDLERTVESVEQTLVKSKLGAENSEEVHEGETEASVVSVESAGGAQPVGAD